MEALRWIVDLAKIGGPYGGWLLFAAGLVYLLVQRTRERDEKAKDLRVADKELRDLSMVLKPTLDKSTEATLAQTQGDKERKAMLERLVEENRRLTEQVRAGAEHLVHLRAEIRQLVQAILSSDDSPADYEDAPAAVA